MAPGLPPASLAHLGSLLLSLNLLYLLTQINLGLRALIKLQGGSTTAAGGRDVGVWIHPLVSREQLQEDRMAMAN